MTVTASGDLKVRIVSERSTHVMDAVLAEWVFAVYKKDGDDFVFTGPYAVKKFVDGDHIDLVANEHYPQAIERPDIVLKKYAGGNALARLRRASRSTSASTCLSPRCPKFGVQRAYMSSRSRLATTT
jgi:ABC-type transport system substrate-binding protein